MGRIDLCEQSHESMKEKNVRKLLRPDGSRNLDLSKTMSERLKVAFVVDCLRLPASVSLKAAEMLTENCMVSQR